MTLRPRIALACWLSCLTVATTEAATVTLHPNGNVVVLEGRIERGDLDKVRKLVTEAAPTALYLASRGGDLAEAMRIGFFVRGRGWETRSAEPASMPPELRIAAAASMGVRDPARNNVCASACFFIFASGVYRDGHGLGIHTPKIAAADLERMTSDESVGNYNDVKNAVARFLGRMSVPRKYFDAMFDVPHDKMRWLTDEEITSDLHGFVTDVREWVATQCPGEVLNSTACKDKVMLGIRLRALQEKPAN